MTNLIKCPILLNNGGSNVYSYEYAQKIAEIHEACTLPANDCPSNNPPMSEEDYMKAICFTLYSSNLG